MMNAFLGGVDFRLTAVLSNVDIVLNRSSKQSFRPWERFREQGATFWPTFSFRGGDVCGGT